MTSLLRIGMTETVNAFASMPDSVNGLDALHDQLDAIRDANVAHHVDLIAQAAKSGVAALGLGELFTGPYFALTRHPIWREMAEDALDGPTIRTMRAAARRHSMVLICPLYELCPESGKRFNTAVAIDADGEVLGRYRKTHIPEGANEQGHFCERFYYERSDGELGHWPKNVSSNPYFPVFDSRVGRIAVAICYDRHFPRVAATLSEQGAELIFSPAVTFGADSRRMWELEFLVDAARHRVFIAGSNRRGTEQPWQQEFFGNSYVAGPNGRVAHVLDPPAGLVLADIDLLQTRAPNPAGWTLRQDQRHDIYGLPRP